MKVQALIQKPLNFCSYEEASDLTSLSWGPDIFGFLFLHFLGDPRLLKKNSLTWTWNDTIPLLDSTMVLASFVTRLGQLHPPHVSHCQYVTMAFHGLSLGLKLEYCMSWDLRPSRAHCILGSKQPMVDCVLGPEDVFVNQRELSPFT
jgi:hypothetical protein